MNSFTGGVGMPLAPGISTRGYGHDFSTELAYDSMRKDTTPGYGGGWMCGSTSSLDISPAQVNYRKTPNGTKSFIPGTGGAFPPRYFVQDQLNQNETSGNYTLTTKTGRCTGFLPNGKVSDMKTPSGDVCVCNYTSDKLTQVKRPLLPGLRSGSGEWDFGYNWNGDDNASDIVFSVDGRAVLKTTYDYDTDKRLKTIKVWENSAAAGDPEDWGTVPIQATRYAYHAASGLLRYVLQPDEYLQMANNGIDPDTAGPAELQPYATNEYVYNAQGQVLVLYARGRRYLYGFNYVANPSGTSGSVNQWVRKTEIIRPDGSKETNYFNSIGQIILKRIDDAHPTPTKTWYPLYQRFEEGSARIVLSANHSAIKTVLEADPGLVELEDDKGMVKEYTYTPFGKLESVVFRNGALGTEVPQRLLSYISRSSTEPGTIHVVDSEMVFGRENADLYITTTYSYEWHGDTFQPSKITTVYPAVSLWENGRGNTTTSEQHFDEEGYLTKTVDQLGTATTYEYDKLRGGMIAQVVDEGSGRLNLRTDWTLDDRGRRVLELGPEHIIDLEGVPTAIRRASWTYYKDREGERWSFAGYRTTVGTPLSQIVGPVTVEQSNLVPPSGYSGWRQDSTFDAVYTSGGIPLPATVFSRSSWVRWTVRLLDQGSELKEQRTYFDIPSSGEGSQSVNYGKKLFAYDSTGRQNQTTCAGGTIDKTTYNVMGWPVQEELGTSAGLTVTRTNAYDDDGNLVQETLPVDSTSANDRVTLYRYDWRNRQIEMETSVEQSAGNPADWVTITRLVYENRNLVTSSTRYQASVASANRIAYQTSEFDVLGRQFRARVYGVSGATDGNYLESNVYYDATGQLVRNAPAGSKLFNAIQYDRAGRTVATFQAYESSGYTPGSDPADVSEAVVIEQQEQTWDNGGNLVATTGRQRFDTASGDGPLQTPATEPKARVSYVAIYPDALGRSMASANYGTNGGGAWTRSTVIPVRSDTVLIDSNRYDDAGNLVRQTNPGGIHTCRTYDKADRLVKLVENCPESTSSSSSSSSSSGSASSSSSSSWSGSGSGGPDYSTDVRTTHYEYTDDGWLRKLKSDNAATGQQVTEWVYGVTPAQGSELYSNRQVHQKIYPDSTGASDRVTYTYNRQLQTTKMIDQAGTTHVYGYDRLGRLLTDAVTAFGSGIDTSVGKLESVYNVDGWLARAISWDVSGTTKVNEVFSTYTRFGQLNTQFQQHAGAVVIPTTPRIRYAYEDGSSNTIRPTGIAFPRTSAETEKFIQTNYTGAISDAISRPDQVKEDATVVASMRYLGLSTSIGLKYDAASNAELTYENGSTGDAGDKYTGLDRFGRLVETIWKKGSTDLVHSKYGRNRMSGIDWRRDLLSTVTPNDNYYWYDGLQQVTRHDRGNLTPPSGPPYTGINPTTRAQQEDFAFDETGNWLRYSTTSPALSQYRTHNAANEITTLYSGPPFGLTPSYDPVGNMKTLPKPDDWWQEYSCKWDAWNRLMEVTDGFTPVASYAYDALARRVSKTTSAESRHYYYNHEWRAIEERISGAVERQYVWSPLDRWTLIRRQRSVSSVLDEILFALKDHLDPVAFIDELGNPQERFTYDAFGDVVYMDSGFNVIPSTVNDWNYLFHGEFIDDDVGLYNYGYRLYSCRLGRWISRDPIEEKGGMNLYGSFKNDPMNIVDYLGRHPAVVGVAGAVEGVLVAFGVTLAACLATPACAKALRDAVEAAVDAIPILTREVLRLQCQTLHAQYKLLEDTCGACKNPQKCPNIIDRAKACASATVSAACWSTVVALRSSYMLLGCDFVLVENWDSHAKQLDQKNNALLKCIRKQINNCTV